MEVFKLFEYEFGKLIGEIISSCLEYSNDVVEDVYIYMNFLEKDVTFKYLFFTEGNVIYRKNVSGDKYRDYRECIDTVICSKIQQIKENFIKYNKKIPLELKVNYSVIKKRLRMDSNYDDYSGIRFNDWIKKLS